MSFFQNLFGPKGYDHLTVAEYQVQFPKKNSHTLVDVRTKQEFAQGHLPGAINIPLNELSYSTGKVSNKKPVVVVCATGNRSLAGASAFVRAGHAEVYNLQGGTMAWARAGGAIARK